MLSILELIGEWIAAIIILGAIVYTALEGIGYLIYRRKHKDDEI